MKTANLLNFTPTSYAAAPPSQGEAIIAVIDKRFMLGIVHIATVYRPNPFSDKSRSIRTSRHFPTVVRGRYVPNPAAISVIRMRKSHLVTFRKILISLEDIGERNFAWRSSNRKREIKKRVA